MLFFIHRIIKLILFQFFFIRLIYVIVCANCCMISVNMTLVGLSQGPLHHYFYIYLHKFFPRRTLDNVIKKILMDQFVMSPLCIVTFFYTICYLNKQSLLDSTQELKNKFLQVYMVNAHPYYYY